MAGWLGAYFEGAHNLHEFWLRWVAGCKGLPQVLAGIPITVAVQVGVTLLEQFLSLGALIAHRINDNCPRRRAERLTKLWLFQYRSSSCYTTNYSTAPSRRRSLSAAIGFASAHAFTLGLASKYFSQLQPKSEIGCLQFIFAS